jgi:hypothetical protein
MAVLELHETIVLQEIPNELNVCCRIEELKVISSIYQIDFMILHWSHIGPERDESRFYWVLKRRKLVNFQFDQLNLAVF